MNKLLQKIRRKLEGVNALQGLTLLSGSEFNTMQLEVFQQRVESLDASDVLKAFEENRFVAPGLLDPVQAKELELQCLRLARDEGGFLPLTISPVAPLGSCAAVATVHQNKILSSVRGTEVVADATNVLMLHIASELKRRNFKGLCRYCTVHRHVRGQSFNNPDYAAHFAVHCQASAALDGGNYTFEFSELRQHIKTIVDILSIHVPVENLSIRFLFKDQDENFQQGVKAIAPGISAVQRLAFQTDLENKYYQRLQFKVYIHYQDNDVDIADGGFVDWPRKFTGNNKLRGMISGIGLELLQKLFL